MNFIYNVFGVPFGFLMRIVYNLVNNYGLAIILFTLVTKIILLPVNYKTQKSSARMQLLNPKLEKLRKSYANNPQKLQEEQMKLYQQEGVNPMGSCLPAIVQMVLLFGVLDVVYRPLTHILRFNKSIINSAIDVASNILGSPIGSSDLRRELTIFNVFSDNPSAFSSIPENFSQKVSEFGNNFSMFGVNLGMIPDFTPETWTYQSIGLFLIPILAGVSQLLSTIYSRVHQKRTNPDAMNMAGGGCMNVMMYIMPLVSVMFAYQVPAGVGVYWIFSSLFSLLVTFLLNCYFTKERIEKIVAKDRAKAAKYAEVNGGKKTFMQRMLEQQQAMNVAEENRNQVQYDENGKKLSRSEINEYNRNAINAARKRMAEKYGDSYDENDDE